MNQILDTSEILGTLQTLQGECELCASANADYSGGSGKLNVRLGARVRPVGVAPNKKPIDAPWLPKHQTVSESVGIDEAGALARDIFQSWVRKVRAAAPSLHRTTF